jgi:hypothetical protein
MNRQPVFPVTHLWASVAFFLCVSTRQLCGKGPGCLGSPYLPKSLADTDIVSMVRIPYGFREDFISSPHAEQQPDV